MSDIGDEVFFRVGGILHESRMQECYGNTEISSRRKWPETFKDFRGQRHEGQPWIDVAIAQVRALIKVGLIEPSAPLAQRIEHEPSKLGVEGSNPSGRAKPYPLSALAKFLYEYCGLNPDQAGDVAAVILSEYHIGPNGISAGGQTFPPAGRGTEAT